MAVSVQITLIICLTVLALTFMSKFIDDEWPENLHKLL